MQRTIPGWLESCHHHDGRNNKHCPTSSVSVLVSVPHWPGLVAAVSSKWPPLASSSSGGAGRDSFPPSWHQQSAVSSSALAVFTTASRVPSVVNCVQLSRARLPPAQQRTHHTPHCTVLEWVEISLDCFVVTICAWVIHAIINFQIAATQWNMRG